MPLRSVEAATRDDAIAAAREQFGPQARVVGVRRVRSGGVLGFFATERYVAEVAPDAGRPPVPAPGRGTRDDDLGSSPLASASPATAAPTSARARASAPARNGAAAYAAEAVRSPEPARPATQAAARSLGWTAGAPAEAPVDDARVSELAGLLGAPAAEPKVAVLRPPRLPAERRHPEGHLREGALDGGAGRRGRRRTRAGAPVLERTRRRSPPPSRGWSPATPTSARPSRTPSATSRTGRPRRSPPPEPSADRSGRRPRDQQTQRCGPVRRARRRKRWEIRSSRRPPCPSSSRWRCPPGSPSPRSRAAPDSSREEAIAEVLRSALAQGHSDEALAGILRKVLDGVAPQAALPEPEPARPSCGCRTTSSPSSRALGARRSPSRCRRAGRRAARRRGADVDVRDARRRSTRVRGPVVPRPRRTRHPSSRPRRTRPRCSPFAPRTCSSRSRRARCCPRSTSGVGRPRRRSGARRRPRRRWSAPTPPSGPRSCSGSRRTPPRASPWRRAAEETVDELLVETFDEPVAEPVLEALIDESEIPVDEIEIAEIEVLGVEIPRRRGR